MAQKKTNYTRHLEKRLKSPRHITGLLNVVIADPDKRVFLLTMRDVIKANGGFLKLARDTGISREHLYYIFSDKGNPTFETIQKVLNQYGVRFSISRFKEKKAA